MKKLPIDTLPVADIQVSQRLREISQVAVDTLVASIREIGHILHPVQVQKVKDGWRLLDGAHRLTAAAILGFEEVPVVAFECTNSDAVKVEVDGNAAGAPLNALDMAVFLAARKKIYEKENPEARRGSAGGMAKNGVLTDTMSVSSFAANAAEIFGKGERQIFRLISVGEKLSPDEIADLRSAPNKVQFKDLEHIAKSGDAKLRAEICRDLGNGTAKSAKEVLDRRKLPGVALKNPTEEALNRIQDAWARAPQAAKNSFVADHADELRALLDRSSGETGGEVVSMDFSSRRGERHG